MAMDTKGKDKKNKIIIIMWIIGLSNKQWSSKNNSNNTLMEETIEHQKGF